MDAGAKALLIGNLCQQDPKPIPLCAAQRSTQIVLMLTRNGAQQFELGFAGGRQTQSMRPPVSGFTVALDEAFFFKPIEQEHDAAGECAKVLGEDSLGNVGLVRQIPKNSGLGWGQAERHQAFGEARGGMCAYLGDEEGGAGPAMSSGHSY